MEQDLFQYFSDNVDWIENDLNLQEPITTPTEIKNGNSMVLQNLTKISEIQPGMIELNLMGRVVNLTDIKPHMAKGTMYGFFQTILIKDDTGLIAAKLYLRQNIQINLDIVLLIKSTKCVSSPAKENQNNQNCYHPFNMTKWIIVDEIMSDNSSLVIADESKQILFKKPLGSKDDVIDTIDMNFKTCLPTHDKVCQGKLLVVVQTVQNNQNLVHKKRDLIKVTLNVSDEYNKGMMLTLWNQMTNVAEAFIPYKTTLLITNPTKTLFQNKLQIGIGASSYIEVNPECKNSKWILNFAKILNESNVDKNKQSKSILEIDSIDQIQKILSNMNMTDNYIFEFEALIIELNIDDKNDSKSPLAWKCANCGKFIRSNTEIEICQFCEGSLDQSSLKFDLYRKLSFIDQTAMVYHPYISEEASNKIIGCKPSEFLRLTHGERVYLKVSKLFSKFKILLKVSLDFDSQELQATINDLCQK